MKVEGETLEQYIARVNSLTDDEVDVLIASDSCPYEPERLVGCPIGMFHCPLCGEMVLAGLPHPRVTDEG